MFDVFYLGKKPNLFAHELPVESLEQAQLLSRTRFFWIVNYLSDYSDFDFLWEPVPWQAHQRHAWSSQWQKDSGTYLIPKAGYNETNYHTDVTIVRLPNPADWQVPNNIDECEFDFSWHPDPTDPPMTYCFGTQWQRSGGPIYYNGGNDIKFVSLPRARAQTTQEFWHVPDNIDHGSFDFSWHPDVFEPAYVYQFGTQWQKTGGPRYVVPGALEVKYVTQTAAKVTAENTAIVEIDHLDNNAGQIPNTVRQVRYFNNYRDTLIRIAKNFVGQYEYVWVCSSICDYTNFDFSWHPESWQSTMLHVFASNEQKFGDTFFMHVPTFAEQAEKKALLDWYDVNYVPNISVPRRSMPVVFHNNDTHVEAVKMQDWAGPLALFTVDTAPVTLPTVSLWRQETKNIVPLSPGASAVIVPKTAKADIRTQLYDYPFIDKTQRSWHKDYPLDIVFISNGESNAFEHWTRLINHTGYRANRVVHVSGVNGRVAAYHAAAQASRTPWFFAVFAKLEVDAQFDWSWQPDRMQEPKHYIFHAENPVNGLVYGHQAMIAYNRDLVLANSGHGLDFTLDSAHEVVPVLSGIARYNDTPWMTWRTAFREVLKLCASQDVDSQYRLTKWLKNSQGQNGEWSIRGAEDAVEYYQSVNGDFEALRKSYDWAWLASYALIRRNLTPDL